MATNKLPIVKDPDCFSTNGRDVHPPRYSEQETVRTPYTRTNFGIPLYTYNELPLFLKGNPYITCGYRAQMPLGMCFKSLFIWSNETVNIWTHLFGLLYFTYLLLEDNFVFLPKNNGVFGDYLTFNFLNSCFVICMFCSAGYHLFNCLSESASKKWLGLDLGGVSVGLCGCYFPGAFYAFFCQKYCQIVYMVLMFMLAFASMFAQLHPQFLSTHWYLRRIFLYSAIVFAGIVPVLHWVVTNGGPAGSIVQEFMPKIVVMYMLATVGGTLYITRFPESRFPGKVDFIGSSHQWWHTLVLLCFSWAHHCAVDIFIYWKTHTCSEHWELHPAFHQNIDATP